MINRFFLFGVIGGIAVTVAVASLIATGAATAQMMPMSNQQMMHYQQMQQNPHQGMKQGMFSASGMSMVQDVRITGVSITGEDEIAVSMMYSGNGTSPDLTVVAMTNHMGMMSNGWNGGMMNNSMMDMSGMGMYGMPAYGNGTQYHMMQTQSGSSTVDAGWELGDEVTVTLDGDLSAYDVSDVHVMVFPHIT